MGWTLVDLRTEGRQSELWDRALADEHDTDELDAARSRPAPRRPGDAGFPWGSHIHGSGAEPSTPLLARAFRAS